MWEFSFCALLNASFVCEKERKKEMTMILRRSYLRKRVAFDTTLLWVFSLLQNFQFSANANGIRPCPLQDLPFPSKEFGSWRGFYRSFVDVLFAHCVRKDPKKWGGRVTQRVRELLSYCRSYCTFRKYKFNSTIAFSIATEKLLLVPIFQPKNPKKSCQNNFLRTRRRLNATTTEKATRNT